MKKRVLVVDDDPAVRLVHSRFVEQLGYDVEMAEDGVEALTKLALGVDLVLLDLYMPNMDGFEVASKIRQHPTYGLVPIIIITGSDKEAWYPRALEVGANDVLAKPINADELRLRTRWLMELKSSHDRLSESNVRLAEAVERATASMREALERATESERRIRSAHLDTITRLTIAAEYKDETIAGHLLRVGLAAGFLARAVGLPSGQAEMIRHAAPMHDVGMIGIPDQILFKEGPLDEVGQGALQNRGGAPCRIGFADHPNGRDHRAPPPRALGRVRLSGRAGGRGHPAGGPHLRDRGLLRLVHDGPAVSGGTPPRSGDRVDDGGVGDPFRPRAVGRVLDVTTRVATHAARPAARMGSAQALTGHRMRPLPRS
jgi:CheY-like chemotaxis protein